MYCVVCYTLSLLVDSKIYFTLRMCNEMFYFLSYFLKSNL